MQQTSLPVFSGPRVPELVESPAVGWGEWLAGVALELRASAHDVEATTDVITRQAEMSIPGVDRAHLVQVGSAEFACLIKGSALDGPAADGSAVNGSAVNGSAADGSGNGSAVAGSAPDGSSGSEPHRSLNRVVGGETFALAGDIAVVNLPAAYRQGMAVAGSCTLLILRLCAQERFLGALVLLSVDETPFPAEIIHGASLYAAHAAVAMANAQDLANLRAAIDGRDQIGQAKGILMERYKLTDDQAFMLLAKISQNTNTPLRMVAEQLTRTGEVPSAAHR